MRIFFCFVLISLTYSAKAHEYHFAFAEAEYNTETKTVQATISVSTRDFEHALSHEGITIQALEKYADNELMQFSLAQRILEHFKMSIGNTNCSFNYIGYEVLTNGNTNFYFESQEIEATNEISVVFDLMMEHNPKQQNKLNFIYLTEKRAIEFLPNDPIRTFKLESI